MRPQEDFGRTVLDGTGIDGELLIGRPEFLGESEISNAYPSSLTHEQVLRFHVLHGW